MTESERGPTEEQRVQLWSRVPYHEYGRVTAPAAADIVDFVDVSQNERVLDVACGTGNTAITAARRGADATGIDLNPDMLEWAEENAGLVDADIAFKKGDALDLPVEDDAYDVVLSTFGHQLTSDPVAATRELARVNTVRRSGRIRGLRPRQRLCGYIPHARQVSPRTHSRGSGQVVLLGRPRIRGRTVRRLVRLAGV